MKENNEDALTVLEKVVYPVSIDEIKAFKAEWAEVPTLDPLAGIKDETFLEVKKAHLKSVTLRNMIEKKRKSLKEPALAYGKSVDAIAKEYKALLEDTEKRLFSERHRVEVYEQEQEQKRIDAERERVENIGRSITALQMLISSCVGLNSVDLVAKYESVEIPTEEFYQERHAEAMEVYKDTMNKLESMISTAKSAEEVEAVRVEAEKKHQAEKAELEAQHKAEREAFAKEKAEFEAEKKAQADIVEAREEAERMRVAEINERALIEEQEQAEALRQEVNIAERKIAINEAVHALQHELNKGLNAEDIIESIINCNIPHVTWEV